MKGRQIIRYFVFAVLVLFSLFFPVLSAQISGNNNKTNDLSVILTGLKSNKGSIIIKLFNSKESYKIKGSKAYREMSVMIINFRAEAHFTVIAPGEYAIKLFHDENGNGIHDKNFLGIPREDYAFSNNATGFMGPPDYDKTRFELKNDLILTINISKDSEQ